MVARRPEDDAPEGFARALETLRAARLRPEVILEEAPAPQRLAPHAVALTADVVLDDEEIASGRFVVLHDPDGHEAWEGHYRVVTFARAPVDREVADDPVLPAVGWSWLLEALAAREAEWSAASGTVTRVSSEHFGGMEDRSDTAEVEIRASWTPHTSTEHPWVDLGPHLQAWADLLAELAGLPPLAPGVVALPRQRRT
jgi:hypothetical protein